MSTPAERKAQAHWRDQRRRRVAQLLEQEHRLAEEWEGLFDRWNRTPLWRVRLWRRRMRAVNDNLDQRRELLRQLGRGMNL